MSQNVSTWTVARVLFFSCGSRQQQMSSLWETNLVFTLYVDSLPPGCLYYRVYFLSFTHPVSFTWFTTIQSVFFHILRLLSFCLRHGVLHSLHLPLNKYFQSHSHQHSFSSLCQTTVSSCSSSSLCLLFSASCSSSAHFLPPHSSHSLCKQLGFF